MGNMNTSNTLSYIYLWSGWQRQDPAAWLASSPWLAAGSSEAAAVAPAALGSAGRTKDADIDTGDLFDLSS